jgi:hypothetical protein
VATIFRNIFLNGYHPLEDLAKYGYKPNRKYINFLIIILYFLVTHEKPAFRNLAKTKKNKIVLWRLKTSIFI